MGLNVTSASSHSLHLVTDQASRPSPWPPAWVRDYFGAAYGHVYRALVDEETELEAEADWMAGTLGWGAQDTVLDLACGYGRHLRHLIRLPGQWVALDLIRDQLRLAQRACTGEHAGRLSGLIEGDMNHLPFRSGSIRAVLLLFNSFGYRAPTETGGQDPEQRLLGEVERTLTPNGQALLELPNRDNVVRAVDESPHSELAREGLRLTEDWRVERGGTVLHGVSTFHRGGDHESVTFTVRLFSLAEITRMATAVGLRPVNVWGDLRGGDYHARRSGQMVVHLERRR
jgi:SAM-dependent methyltransferase